MGGGLKRKSHPMDGGSSHLSGTPRKTRSGNLGGGRETGAGRGRQIRHKANCYISHSRVGQLVAKVLPWRKELSNRFVVEFRHNLGVYLEERMNCAHQEGSGVGCVPTFGRTPLSIISMSLGKCIDRGVKSGVSVPRKRMTDLHESALSSLVRVTPDIKSLSSDGRRVGVYRVYLLTCVLNRALDGVKPKMKFDAGGSHVVLPRAYSVEDLSSSGDFKYRAAIAYIPSAATFYCHREKRGRSDFAALLESGDVAPSRVGKKGPTDVGTDFWPMDASWLRLIRHPQNGGISFAKGGYVRTLLSVHMLEIDMMAWVCGLCVDWREDKGGHPQVGVNRSVSVIHGVQFHDMNKTVVPCLPPDIIRDGSGHVDEELSSINQCQQWYLERYDISKSAKIGGRHYVKGALYGGASVMQNAYIVDVTNGGGGVDIEIAIHGPPLTDGDAFKRTAMVEQTTLVEVRHVMGLNSACDILQPIVSCGDVLHCSNSLGVRKKGGDRGHMIPIGCRVDPRTTEDDFYVATNLLQSQSEPYLLEMSDVLEYVGQVMFVGTQRVMRDLERSAQQVPCDDMRGKHDCGMCTQDFSINLTNSSHYDVGDASRGYAVWVEGGAVRGKSGNDGWYFVLPNVVVVSGQEGGECEKGGIAIRLGHGVTISWDGRVLRHCTSQPIAMSQEGNRFGVFVAAKKRTSS